MIFEQSPEILQLIAAHLDLKSYDHLRLSFKSSLPLMRHVNVTRYGCLSNSIEACRSKIYGEINNQTIQKMILMQDFVNLPLYIDRLIAFPNIQLQFEIGQLCNWEAWKLQEIRPVIIHLHEMLFLGSFALELFCLLDDLENVENLLQESAVNFSIVKKCVLFQCVKVLPLIQNTISDEEQKEVFLLAVQKDLVSSFKLLYQNMDISSQFTSTIKHCIDNGSIKVLEFLLEQKSVTLAPKGQELFLQTIIEKGYEDIGCLLLKRGILFPTTMTLKDCIKADLVQIAKELLDDAKYLNIHQYASCLELLTTTNDHPGLVQRILVRPDFKDVNLLVNKTQKERLLTRILNNAIAKEWHEAAISVLEDHRTAVTADIVHLSIKNGLDQIVCSMFKKQPELCKKDTALMAIQYGLTESASFAIHHCVNGFEKWIFLKEAMNAACTNGRLNMLQLLVAQNARVTRSNIATLIKRGDAHIMEFILPLYSENQYETDSKNIDIIMIAIESGTKDMLDLLLKDGRFVPTKEAIMVALRLSRIDRALALCQDQRLTLDTDIFHYAIQLGLTTIVSHVMKHHPATLKKSQDAAQLIAVRSGRVEILDLLLEKHVFVKTTLEDMFILAIECKQQPIVEYLLAKGMDWHRISKYLCESH